jgi:23S rRNA pseudouridine2605 synthase
MHPVGRLDYDTTGLLLFSSSGALTQTLLHPKHAVEKEYIATVVNPVVDVERLRQTLAAGVTTGEGVHTARLESVEPYREQNATAVTAYLAALRAEIPPSYNLTDLQERGYMDIYTATELSIIRLTVQEGKHRMVRRILANVGHPVVSLHRHRLGRIALDDDLPVGGTRNLSPDELEWAQSILPQPTKRRPQQQEDQQESDETGTVATRTEVVEEDHTYERL